MKVNEIAKFGILDEKRNSQFWTKNGQPIAEKIVNSFSLIGITIMLLQLG